VLGVVVDGVARAYPLRLLNYHWVVHDVIDGRAVAVFWDPIAGAATAYQPTADGVKAQFGATGKVYQGSSLFYEAQTASLFLPITGRFVTGPRAGRVLRALPVVRDRWAGWLKRHRETRVLSADTGYRKPYDVDPFAAAALPPMLAGPGDPQQRLAPGEWVLGFVTPDRKAHCVALRDLPRSEKAKPVPVGEARVVRLPDGQARAALSGGGWPPQVICRYSAWYGAHPDTTVEAGDLSPAVRG
jgi:hypothetical protein